jgi:stage II sporulation protein D
VSFRWWWFIASLLAAMSFWWWNGGERQRNTVDTSTGKEEVRVWLPINENTFTLSASSGSLQVKSVSSPHATPFATKSIELKMEAGRMTLLGEVQGLPLTFKTSSGVISINGREYLGSLHLDIKKNKARWVLHSPLEAYVARVVEGEMSSHWSLEALKAQAVIARSFATFHVRRHRSRDYDLLGDSRSQAFSSTWPSSSSEQAALSTAGRILTQHHKPIITYYHSTCGGATKFFQQEGMIFDSVTCSYCLESPHYSWQQTVPVDVVRTLLSKGLSATQRLKKVTCLSEDSGHVTDIIFSPHHGSSIQVKAITLRKHLNKTYKKEIIKSLKFELKLDAQHNLIITGHGWGYHGIGLCQYGAKKMAELNFSHQDILKHYYPQAKLKKI